MLRLARKAGLDELTQSRLSVPTDKGINHVKIRPRTPRLDGKVERPHQIDSEEFHRLLEGEVIDDANLFAERLQQWEDHYNYDRPHGALGGQTPYERLKQKAQAPLS